MLDREIVAEIEAKRKLIELQNTKRKLLDSITDNPQYLHSLLKQKDPNTLAEIKSIIIQIEQKIISQQDKILQSSQKGISIHPTINTALCNETIVCEEIKKTINNIPALIKKLDELQRKIARTMTEIRTRQ